MAADPEIENNMPAHLAAGAYFGRPVGAIEQANEAVGVYVRDEKQRWSRNHLVDANPA